MLSLRVLLLWAGLGFVSSVSALEFSPLKGGYATGGEVKLQSQVRQLPAGSEGQLRSTCLRASIKNSAPASQYSTETEPVPMLVDFDAQSRSSGVVHLRSVRSVSDPVSVVTLRSDCPLAVFEVSWTVFLTPSSDLPGGKEPRWDIDSDTKVLALNDSDLRDFNLKNSSLLGQSRKPATDVPIPGVPTPETRAQMSRLKNELQKQNTGELAKPEKALTETPTAKAPEQKPAPEKTTSPAANIGPSASVPVPAALPSMSEGEAAPTMASTATAEQTGLVPTDNLTPSPGVQEVALAPTAPVDDLDRLNKNLAVENPVSDVPKAGFDWVMVVFSVLALGVMSFGAFWAYRRFRLKTSAMPENFFRAGLARSAPLNEPQLFEPQHHLLPEDDEPDTDSAPVTPMASEPTSTGKRSKPSAKAEKEKQVQEESLLQEALDEPAKMDSARLFESMLGADGHADVQQAPSADNEPWENPVHDARHREGLELTLHGLERASVKPWKLPVAYASLVAARNRSLSLGVSSQNLRCELGLLELAFQETRRGRLLEQSAVNELVTTLMAASAGQQVENGAGAPVVVSDILKSHLKTKRYELNGAEAQNRFKANCLQLKSLCQVWPFCFSLPEWSVLVSEE